MGGNYSSHRAQNEKHVVVVATVLQADIIMDFLNEFYAHPKLQVSHPVSLNLRLIKVLQVISSYDVRWWIFIRQLTVALKFY